MNIGVFSGSFDPIHFGHLMVAGYMARHADLDCVWLMVTPANPLKEGYKATDADRIEMTRMAASHLRDVSVSDFEFSLPRPSYTYRTLTALKEQYPGDNFRLIIGSDNWLIFDRWRDADKIINEFRPLIYPRPGYDVDPATLPDGVELIPAPVADISSTFIRNEAQQGADVSCYTDAEVARYIAAHHLYAEP